MKRRISVVVAVVTALGLAARAAPLFWEWVIGPLSPASHEARTDALPGLMPVARNLWLPPIPEKWKETTHLIVVPGHAIFGGLNYRDCYDSGLWFLELHQRAAGPAFIDTLMRHIELSVELLEKQPDRSLLVFSGGPNHPEAGPLTEAGSYYQIARMKLLDQRKADGSQPSSSRLLPRMVLEEYARDSLENVLFSICRFYEVVGRYPDTITVVGFEYKRERIENMHREALRWDSSRFAYIGLDVRKTSSVDSTRPLTDTNTLERARRDPYFASLEESVKVKQLKNPQRRAVPYFLSCTELRGLLNHEGPEIYRGSLPWN
jgi:hypothetical protein